VELRRPHPRFRSVPSENLQPRTAPLHSRNTRAFIWAQLLLIYCAFGTSCAIQDSDDPARHRAPPVVAKQEVQPAEQAAKLLDAALKEYADDPAVNALVTAVRSASTAPLTAGNDVHPLVDGPQTFAAIEEAVRAATHHVHVETFIYDDDALGREFAELLAAKRGEGVEVRVLYDSIGSMETDPKFFDTLRQDGIEVREFRPMNPAETPLIWKIQNRDHRKILVVDGGVAFTGGINVSGTYSSSSSSKPGPERGIEEGWRDTHIRIKGPAVAQLQELFIENWERAGEGPTFCCAPEHFPTHSPAGKHLVTIVANDSDESDDRSLYATYLAAFKKSSSRLWITHAYFAPNDDLLDAMTEAAARGVDVRLITPGFTDSNVILFATRSTYTRLLKGGVRIYERNDALLHAKSVVIDGAVSIVGSANLDMRSFIHNDEANAIIISRDFGARMEQIFERDQEAAHALDLDTWQQRPLMERLREFGSKLLWYWL
jgi:cardiolipin synthase A/B